MTAVIKFHFVNKTTLKICHNYLTLAIDVPWQAIYPYYTHGSVGKYHKE